MIGPDHESPRADVAFLLAASAIGIAAVIATWERRDVDDLDALDAVLGGAGRSAPASAIRIRAIRRA
jgi:hypothetical protein